MELIGGADCGALGGVRNRNEWRRKLPEEAATGLCMWLSVAWNGKVVWTKERPTCMNCVARLFSSDFHDGSEFDDVLARPR